MSKISDVEYLKMDAWQRFWYKIGRFFAGIPKAIWGLLCAIGRFFKNAGCAIGREVSEIVTTFLYGDWKTKLSYLFMGFAE